MIRYVARRFYHSIFMILGITVTIFVITNVLGDPAILLMDPEAPREHYEQLRHNLGLDRPLYIQYFIFIKGAIAGDFGKSFLFREQAMTLVLEHMPATIELAIASILFAVVAAIPLGVVSAVKPYSVIDRVCRLIAFVGQAAPGYWLGILAILVFGAELRWLPISGRGGISHLIMPATTLGMYTLAAIMRLTRSAMLDVLDQEYIRTARIKGLRESTVILKHAFKNALIPVLTIVSLFLGRLLGGAVVTETIFAWPGLGRLSVQAIHASDFPLVQASVFLMSIGYISINLIVDLLYCAVDPRIKYE